MHEFLYQSDTGELARRTSTDTTSLERGKGLQRGTVEKARSPSPCHGHCDLSFPVLCFFICKVMLIMILLLPTTQGSEQAVCKEDGKPVLKTRKGTQCLAKYLHVEITH